MSRNLCITSADGQTGHLTAELILTTPDFANKLSSLTLLAQDGSKCADLNGEYVHVVEHSPGDSIDSIIQALKNAAIDTILLIPPAHEHKMQQTKKMIEATRAVGVKNVILLSAAGCDFAEKEKQPRLREFVDIEALVLRNKGDTRTEAGHSPCVIRAGFYAENLLLYNSIAQKTGILPLPIGSAQKFAPVALGDVAHVAAIVSTSEGPMGLADHVRGQLIIVTGPMLVAGNELANSASQALGTSISFKDITEKEAKEILDPADISEAEKEYLLEYYSLVKEGKANYVSTLAFRALTGQNALEPPEFFKLYEGEFRPRKNKTALPIRTTRTTTGSSAMSVDE